MTAYASASNSAYALEDEAWWVQRWVELLNTYRFKKRLERGRIYAREGHILSLEYKGSKVTALVQGTAEEPYKLSIWLDAFSDEDWNYVIDSLSEQAIYSAQLLAGEMPAEIEAVFTANGLSLYPFNLSEVHSKCSCPDPKNPCKHIAAVYYQLGDFFREDPFVLFQLRGRSRDSILEALRQRRQSTAAPAASLDPSDESGLPPEPNVATNQLDLCQFWAYTEPLDPDLVVITPAETTVLDVLGKIPLPPDDAPVVMGHLKEIYQTVAQQAMMQALG
ncbi:SWIM zinc finger family protein [Nodosilinea sp. PGN35]|uniref:SWIM zinc finger family protein n=1 Tax=Nodosilinea sp. PGN35 TaxID=3020489 RepID=UPI0023B31547|nr:SWIM zinc finger family protein [Nodosilinea sp. TSF1-S3]MDF0369346.1 SWIM zinc finger family protein [Nodosilinea sp. TSF1-S3]